jgi:hypothetical protein
MPKHDDFSHIPLLYPPNDGVYTELKAEDILRYSPEADTSHLQIYRGEGVVCFDFRGGIANALPLTMVNKKEFLRLAGLLAAFFKLTAGLQPDGVDHKGLPVWCIRLIGRK